MPALSNERKLSRQIGQLLNPSFSSVEFALLVSIADLWIREKFLEICLAFVDHNGNRWFNQTHNPGEEDFFIACARMSEAFRPYR